MMPISTPATLPALQPQSVLQNAMPGLSPLIPNPTPSVRQVYGLTQIDGLQSPKQFTAADGSTWTRVKAATDSLGATPDPNRVLFTDAWGDAFPAELQTPVYFYCCEGIYRPVGDIERPCRVLFAWFSRNKLVDFAPQHITPLEWQRANVYSAEAGLARTSILCAMCGVQQPVVAQVQKQQAELIRLEPANSGRKPRQKADPE